MRRNVKKAIVWPVNKLYRNHFAAIKEIKTPVWLLSFTTLVKPKSIGWCHSESDLDPESEGVKKNCQRE